MPPLARRAPKQNKVAASSLLEPVVSRPRQDQSDVMGVVVRKDDAGCNKNLYCQS